MSETPSNEIEKNNYSLVKILNTQIANWCTDTTGHGLPHIFKSKNKVMKIIWTIFCITSFSYCFYTIIQCFISYFNYNVAVTILKVNDLQAVFPAVTICNLNPFNEMWGGKRLNDAIQNTDDGKCFLNDTLILDCLNHDYNSAYKKFIDQLKRSIANNKALADDDLKILGYDLDYDMLISCQYNKVSCDAKNFTRYWDNNYGNCYTFNNGDNSTELLKSGVTGENNGLELELVVIPSSGGINIGYTTGIHLIVHNQSEVPFTLNKGVNIQPGTETSVSVNREFTNKLGSPYSNCLSDLLNPPNDYAVTLFSYFNFLNVTYYDQNFCFTLCFQDKLIASCNCSDIITKNILDVKYCESSNELECLSKFKNSFSSSYFNSLCEYACPSQCQSIEYKLSLSTSAFPTLRYAKNVQTIHYDRFRRFTSDAELIEYCRQGFLKIVVSYENIYYTAIGELAAMTLNGLFGNLGGQMGLFIGISFLSLVEVIELIVTICVTIFNQKKRKIQNSKCVSVTTVTTTHF